MFVLIALAAALAEQSSESGERGIWAEKLLGAREEVAVPKTAEKTNQPKKLRPRPAPTEAFLGFTLWQLRSPEVSDEVGARLFEHGPDEDREWIPIRLSGNSMLEEGQRVRFGVETTRAGYLYIVNRELYAGGQAGRPYLIFPTSNLHNGNNRVQAGRVVELPGLNDRYPYFTVRRLRNGLVRTAEELTFLVTPEPLPNLVIGPTRQAISPEQFDSWKRLCRKPEGPLERASTQGTKYTQREKEAAGADTPVLTNDDPAPQTLYRVTVGLNEPMGLTLVVPIKSEIRVSGQ
jgi:hypothetical protein